MKHLNHSHLRSLAAHVLAILIAVFAIVPALAGEADVINATIHKVGRDEFRINATLEHADTGWDHYANKWEVFDTEGNLLGTRVLHHPHVDEQPFTRSLTLTIPKDISEVIIRAGDSVHEAGGKEFTLIVPH